jgi:hypothetical protein
VEETMPNHKPIPHIPKREEQHFGMEQWLDFARGLTDPTTTAVMRKHLASGCPKCKPHAVFFLELDRICRSLAAREVPLPALRLAYQIFPASHTGSFQTRAPSARRMGRYPTNRVAGNVPLT